MHLRPVHILVFLLIIGGVAFLAYSFIDRGITVVDSGFPCPEVSGKTPTGETVKLSDYQGNYIILSFWASWSEPCLEQMQNLKSLKREFNQSNFPKSDSLVFFMFSLDENEVAWQNTIQKDSLDWAIHATDFNSWESPVKDDFSLQTIPNNFLIDPSGVVIGQDLTADEIRDILEKQLNTASIQ
jgi:peroxiredoxin